MHTPDQGASETLDGGAQDKIRHGRAAMARLTLLRRRPYALRGTPSLLEQIRLSSSALTSVDIISEITNAHQTSLSGNITENAHSSGSRTTTTRSSVTARL